MSSEELIPRLEAMILDLKGRGWIITHFYYITRDKYNLEMFNNLRTESFYATNDTFKGAITEAWRHCK